MADLLVRRDDLREMRIDESAPGGPIDPGEIRLTVQRFGLTANNVTYGRFGDQLGYWTFFAAPDGWGRIPVWGFGTVSASEVPEILVGDRFYGYFPMSSEVTMRAEAGPAGFVESSEHRAALPGFYNVYLRATDSPAFPPPHDSANAVFRPLFMTGWLIADLLEAEGWHDASVVVLTSASSKTSYATACEIASRQGRPALIGLTSPTNHQFVADLGLYDRVLTYEQIDELPADEGQVLVDMAGDPALRRAVHAHAGDSMRASHVVGATHWEAADISSEDVPGPEPVFFFAPARVEQRIAELGPEALQEQIGTAWNAFVERLGSMIEIEEAGGLDHAAGVLGSLLDGSADPRKGYVVLPNG